MSNQSHWETVYQTKDSQQVSWYQPHAALSFEWIAALPLGPLAAVIDVGGGASRLVDELLAAGFEKLTVLDIAGAALNVAQARLGTRAGQVQWLQADMTAVQLPARSVDVWHDRAVFHFLTQTEQRAASRPQLQAALRPGGFCILATFALDGPEKCSGLPVCRYDVDLLQKELGPAFVLQQSARQMHATPFGTEQAFQFACFRYSPTLTDQMDT